MSTHETDPRPGRPATPDTSGDTPPVGNGTEPDMHAAQTGQPGDPATPADPATQAEEKVTVDAPAETPVSPPGALAAPAPLATVAAVPADLAPTVFPAPSGAAPLAADSADPTPRPRRRLRVIGWAVVGLLVVVGGAGIAVEQVNKHVYSPQKLAQQYLGALEAGDASRALDLVPVANTTDDSTDDDATDDSTGSTTGDTTSSTINETADATDQPSVDTSLLADSVYAAAADRPTKGTVTKVEREGDEATITIAYQEGDQQVTQELTARRTGREHVLFDHWELQPTTIGTISLWNAPYKGVSVNGVPLDDYTNVLEVPALPGTYTFSTASTQWLDSTDVVVSVLGDKAVTNSDKMVTPTAAAETEASALIEDHLTRCLASDDALPTSCPNRSVLMMFGMTNISWNLDLAPEYELGDVSGDTITVNSVADGSATVTGTAATDAYGLQAGGTYSTQVNITVSGYVRIDGDKLTYEFTSSF